MPVFHYHLVDVFTTEPLAGNPLAVFTDASQLDEVVMQKVAQEMNLAETTFILPPANPRCSARVRIFTPKKEMIFAGHPTIGTAFVLLTEGRLPQDCRSFLLEEKVGTVPISVEKSSANNVSSLIWLEMPPIAEGELCDRAICARALGLCPTDLLEIPPQLLSAGNPTLLIALNNKDAVDRAWLDTQGMQMLRGRATEPFCVFVFCRTAEGAYSRMFGSDYGISEDPATGSSTGPLAAFMLKHGLLAGASATRFISEQGTKIGRRSLLHVRIEGDRGADGIYIGGHVTPIAKGTMTL